MQTVSAAALHDRGYEVTPEGLSVSRDLSLEEWRACGVRLVASSNRLNWAIGDWLVYGSGRGEYGEFYMEAQLITGRSFESLSQYARVSKTFQPDHRYMTIPWTFYREALRLPEQERMRTLTLAQENEWTRDGLANFISTRDGKAPSKAVVISDVTDDKRALRRSNSAGWHEKNSHKKMLQCPSCGFKFEPKRKARVTAGRMFK